MITQLGRAAAIGFLGLSGPDKASLDLPTPDLSPPRSPEFVAPAPDDLKFPPSQRFLIHADKPAAPAEKDKRTPREIPGTIPLEKDSDIQENGELTNNYTLAPGKSQTLHVGTVGAKAVSAVIVGNDGKKTVLKQGESATLKTTDGGSFKVTYVDKLHFKVTSDTVEAITATLNVGPKENVVVFSQYIDPATITVKLDKAPKGVATVGGRDRNGAFGIFTLAGSEKGERRQVTVDCPTGEWTVTADDWVDKAVKPVTMKNQEFYTLHAPDGTVLLGGFNARDKQFTFKSGKADVPPFKVEYKVTEVGKKVDVTVKWLAPLKAAAPPQK